MHTNVDKKQRSKLMRSHHWTAACVLALLFALPATASNAQQTRIGKATSVKPQAEGSIAGLLRADSDVHANETVRTGTSGVADLRFIDQTNLSVGPTSVVRLDKFVYDPNKGSGSVVIDATRGSFRFVAGSQDKRAYKIKTPYGTLGIRG
jgi:hypothetical protein